MFIYPLGLNYSRSSRLAFGVHCFLGKVCINSFGIF